jgi:5-methylcytosine-specific restriction protein A
MKLTTLKSTLQRLPSKIGTAQVDRLRGSAAVKRRANWLRSHPLCARCDQEGRVSAATVPDHIVPLWAGGADSLETNGQSLCHEHHDAKTECEARMRAAGGWLHTPCICGQHAG